jgi:hypothetical protein
VVAPRPSAQDLGEITLIGEPFGVPALDAPARLVVRVSSPVDQVEAAHHRQSG